MRQLSSGLTVIPWTFALQYEMNGRVADSMFVNTALMLIYITKFFWWESGYWCTMDIAHDRGTQFYCRFKRNNFLAKGHGIQMIFFLRCYAFYVNAARMLNLFHCEKFCF